MKKLTAAILSMTLLTGCNAVQVSERVYVNSAYIDKDKDYTVSLEYNEADGTEGNITASGESAESAVGEAERLLGKNIFTGHCRTLFIGNGINNLYGDIAWFAEGGTLAPDAVICRAGGDEILSADNISESFSVLEKAGKSGMPDGNITEAFAELADGNALCLPSAAINDGKIFVSGGEIISGGRRTGYLTEIESTGVQLLRGKKISMSCSDDKTAVEIEKASATKNVRFENGKAVVEVVITAKGYVSKGRLSDARMLSARTMAEAIFAAADRERADRTDFSGFERLIRKKAPEMYDERKISAMLANCEYEITVRTSLYEKQKY